MTNDSDEIINADLSWSIRCSMYIVHVVRGLMEMQLTLSWCEC